MQHPGIAKFERAAIMSHSLHSTERSGIRLVRLFGLSPLVGRKLLGTETNTAGPLAIHAFELRFVCQDGMQRDL